MTFTKPSQRADATESLGNQTRTTQLKVISPRLEWPDKSTLPTMYDLPSEDPEEPGLPDEFHDYQPALLSETFRLQGYANDELFSAADLNLYYDPDHNWYKRPDWFGVLGTPMGCRNDEMRRSYVCWQEELSPFVSVELISPGTEKEDYGHSTDFAGKPPTKWTVYERILQIPYYIIYNRYNDNLDAFRLVEGKYQPMPIGEDRRIWLPEISAGLGFWHGKYQQFTMKWLRWYNDSGWLPTEAEAERARAETERARAEAEKAKKEDLSRNNELLSRQNEALQRKLAELGVDMDDLL
ncbi:MAG: Uma2 family endonuclease [Cyanobacteria bacterium J06581_3]